MGKLVLVTDSTADLPGDVAAEAGIAVAPSRFAFRDQAFSDGDLSPAELYGRMARDGEAPKPFGVPEASFRAIFTQCFEAGESPLCIVSPFDVNPSFTTALAAMLSFDSADMKVIHAGVASVGLGALALSLAGAVRAGWDRAKLLAAIEEAGPQCDALFVPADVAWIERAGRLPLIEEKLGPVDDTALLRVGSRITGVARAASQDDGLTEAARRAPSRLTSGNRAIALVAHAVAADRAERVAQSLRRSPAIARVIVTNLSATIGSQLGPGAIGIGIAPVIAE
ncbi:MAG: DegV family protein [Dehalococcoidia bacterium]